VATEIYKDYHVHSSVWLAPGGDAEQVRLPILFNTDRAALLLRPATGVVVVDPLAIITRLSMLELVRVATDHHLRTRQRRIQERLLPNDPHEL